MYVGMDEGEAGLLGTVGDDIAEIVGTDGLVGRADLDDRPKIVTVAADVAAPHVTGYSRIRPSAR
jgi:hypothetical protein